MMSIYPQVGTNRREVAAGLLLIKKKSLRCRQCLTFCVPGSAAVSTATSAHFLYSQSYLLLVSCAQRSVMMRVQHQQSSSRANTESF